MLQLKQITLSPLLVLFISGLGATSAQAAPGWIVSGKFLSPSQELPVNTQGGQALLVTLNRAGRIVKEDVCVSFKDKGTVDGDSRDSLTQWEGKMCKQRLPKGECSLDITLKKPVTSKLKDNGKGIFDTLDKLALGVSVVNEACEVTGEETIEGELVGEWRNSSDEVVYPETPLEGSDLESGGDSVRLIADDGYELEGGGALEAADEPGDFTGIGTKFTGTSGASTLKAGINTVACKKSATTGEITSVMLLGNIVIHFLECASSGATGSGCEIRSTNTTGKGLVLTTTLHAILGTALPGNEAGLLILPTSGKRFTTLIKNECTPETVVTGSVAGLVAPIGVTQTTSKVVLAVAGGRQEISHIITLTGLVAPELVAFSESATEQVEESLTYEKAIEIT